MDADNHAGKTCYDKEKAYLLGIYLGDGCCHKSKGYGFCIISGDKDVIEKAKIISNGITKKDCQLQEIMPNKTKLYRFRTYSKELFNFLTSETENKSKIPEAIINSNKEIILEFVAGLMDTDGYISSGINSFGCQRYSLGFVNSAQWIDGFIMILRNFGIKVGKKTLKRKYRSNKEKDCYQININLRSFIEHDFYFNCKRKQELLEKYKTNVKYQSY